MNIEALLAVRRAILAEPSAFAMDSWTQRSRESSCGAAHCIAGWLLVQNGYKYDDAAEWLVGPDGLLCLAAIAILNVSSSTADKLFHLSRWPVKFRRDWHTAESNGERAQVAAARIDAFIAEHGDGVG